MPYRASVARRRVAEGDTLPNALAALARTRARSIAEIDELLAARDGTGEPAEEAGGREAGTPQRWGTRTRRTDEGEESGAEGGASN